MQAETKRLDTPQHSCECRTACAGILHITRQLCHASNAGNHAQSMGNQGRVAYLKASVEIVRLIILGIQMFRGLPRA